VQDLTKLSWNITTDLESGLVESSDTVYYLYLSGQGERIISEEKPYLRKDLKGLYHPYHTWRSVGVFFNDGSNDVARVSDYLKFNSIVRLNTGNGYGSVNTTIRRFSVVVDYVGMDIEYNESAASGAEFVIQVSGTYGISYQEDIAAANQRFGISKNSTQLTTIIPSITAADRLISTAGSSSVVTEASTAWTGYLKKGDIIRPHADTNGTTSALPNFTISRLGV